MAKKMEAEATRCSDLCDDLLTGCKYKYTFMIGG